MSSDLSNFYGAAAQTIPVLLLTLAVETTFLAGALRSKRVEQAAASGDWVVVPSLRVEAGGLLVAIIFTVARQLLKLVARPLGVAANATFVFGSLLAAVVAEAAAFIGLAFDPEGTASVAMVIIVLIGTGLLLIENFAALIFFVIRGGQRLPAPAANSPGSPAAPGK